MKMNKCLRIRGKVLQAESPAEFKDKWFFGLWLTEIGGGDGHSFGKFGPYETKTLALAELKCAAKTALESINDEVGGVKGKYVDMTTNEVRNWDEN